jgi:ubiquitin carboxyl-terminal hydrolase 4/11/15
MELYRAPQILIIHLKRFKTSKVSNIGSFYFSHGSKKITAHVDCPLENLDLKPYVLGEGKDAAVYDLYAISNHYGGLGGGHYTAYAKNIFDGKWHEFNDSSVHSTDSKVVSAASYVLFYRKRGESKS